MRGVGGVNRLMKLAKGRRCLVRLPGCDGGGETTVAAHFREQSLGAGMGIRPEALFCAWACFSCHNRVDFRENTDGMTRAEVRLAHAEGVFRTQIELLKLGEISYRGNS